MLLLPLHWDTFDYVFRVQHLGDFQLLFMCQALLLEPRLRGWTQKYSLREEDVAPAPQGQLWVLVASCPLNSSLWGSCSWLSAPSIEWVAALGLWWQWQQLFKPVCLQDSAATWGLYRASVYILQPGLVVPLEVSLHLLCAFSNVQSSPTATYLDLLINFLVFGSQ